MPPPPFSRRGGRRLNAGRKKLTTPVKQAVRNRQLAQKVRSRAYAQKKYFKTEEKLKKLYDRKLSHSDRYRALAVQYVKLAKFLNLKRVHIQLLDILPEMEEDEEPSGSAMDTIDVDQLSDSSDEVFIQTLIRNNVLRIALCTKTLLIT